MILFHNTSASSMRGCILWPETGESLVSDDMMSVSSSDIRGLASVANITVNATNIDSDPLFVDPVGPDRLIGTFDDNLGLRWNSPCVDAGGSSALSSPDLDLDGVPEEVLVETLDELVLSGGAEGAIPTTIAGRRPRPTAPGHVATSMPGNIVAVLVKEGDIVAAGQPVLVTEAMKMETEIQALIAGTVVRVLVRKGDAVNPDEMLVEIAPQ